MTENSILEQQIGSTADALQALGVTDGTLTPAERASLDTQGFVVLNSMIDPRWLAELRAVYERLMSEKYGPWHPNLSSGSATDFWFNESGTRRLADLVSEDPVFDAIYTHPRLLAAMQHILGNDIKLMSLNARDALPGQGQQNFHIDGAPLKPGQDFYLVNSAWLLDDFTVENGATRVIPGSHKIPGPITLSDASAPHPLQQIVTAPAGSVFVFNAHVWHSGTVNRTALPRRVIHCACTQRGLEVRDAQAKRIRKSTYERISPAARYLLDVR